MNMDRDASSTDEYFVTAVQIFDYCGADSSGTLRVDALMEKFAPFIKTNKAEYSYLKSLLDPEHSNPEINVIKLAKALNQYSESQKSKVDLDESFNLKTGPMPQDSDSGISTDGFQLLEDLQCELREKSHLAAQLRSQLDYTDRQHEEALAALTAERDSLRAHLNLLREENAALTDVRHDYEEVCDRLQRSEAQLNDARREFEALRRKGRLLEDQVANLENEKVCLQDLLTKSREECHRINEMYASRQATLREQNETLRTEHADLTVRLQDHDEFMQQIIKEKVLLEMELKELLNKSNHTGGRLDGSIDVSYTEDQMLNELDTLNADSRFSQDGRLLDEESFANALREDQGRATNLSLFDEIRLSFCNVSRTSMFDDYNNAQDCSGPLDFNNAQCKECSRPLDFNNTQFGKCLECLGSDSTKYDKCRDSECSLVASVNIETQTDDYLIKKQNLEPPEYIHIGVQTDNQNIANDSREMVNVSVKIDEKYALVHTTTNVGIDSTKYDNCRDSKCSLVASVNIDTQADDYLTQKQNLEPPEYIHIGVQTDIQNIANDSREMVNVSVQIDEKYALVHTNTNFGINIQTQTDKYESIDNNNREDCIQCHECENLKNYATKLESQLNHTSRNKQDLQSHLDKYEDNLQTLEKFLNEENDRSNLLQSFNYLQTKLGVLEAACSDQKFRIDTLNSEVVCTQYQACQTDCDQASVSTQAESPCVRCEKRVASASQKGLRRYLWDPLKSLFQVFAVVSFLCAVSVLYGVTRRWNARCHRDATSAVPWRWLDAQDLMDLLLRIEYVADVPM